MNCQNSLVSLAYIETSKNPLQVFCNFILYLLLKAPNQTLRADEIKEQLQSDFGISMPHQIISNCTRILERKQEVIRLPHAAGYKIGDTSFDIDSFENTRQRFAEHENKLLNSLVEFVSSQYKQKWSEEEAKEYLSNFLDTEGYGTQLFLKKKLELEQHYISPSFYIGRYVDSIQRQTDSVEKTYLEEIIYGMMVLQGIRQTGDYQQNRQQKFKGTVFYLDTKLVLRALGFSWKAQVDSVRETVRLLREKYDAEIGIFQETRTEVQNALSIAGRAFQKHRLIADGELKLYCELNPSEAKRLEDYADSLDALLERELGINSVTSIDKDDPRIKKYNIKTTEIADYIEAECGWRRGAIDYDVKIIEQINAIREGDYSQAYGGKKKLPVFVTSNSKLAYTFREYISSNEDEIQQWNTHNLPVISDNMLLYRIWLPFATEFTQLPSLTLSRFAYAAQSEGVVFYEKLRNTAAELEQTRNIDLINTTEVARRKIEDILLRESGGNLDSVTDEVVAASLDEYIRMEKLDLLQENRDLLRHSDMRDEQVVKLLGDSYANKIGVIDRALLFLAKWFWIIIAALLYGLFDWVGKNPYLKGVALLPVAIQAIQYWLDKQSDDHNFRFFLYPIALEFVKKRYIQKITMELESKGYTQDTEAVVQYCIQNTKIFQR